MSDTKLDDKTEGLMAMLVLAGILHETRHPRVAVAVCLPCQRDISVLRSRIRELLDEARAEGYESGYGNFRPKDFSDHLPR